MSSNYLCRLKWTWAFYGGGGPPTYALAPVRPHATCRREMGIHFGGWNELVKFEGRVRLKIVT